MKSLLLLIFLFPLVSEGAYYPNVLTSSGDMIYGSTGGVHQRLAAGSNGQVLTLALGVPSWSAGATTGAGSRTRTLNAQTGTTYTLALTDGAAAGTAPLLTMGNASNNTVVVPPNASVAFTTGDQIELVQIGAGRTCLSPGAAVSFVGLPCLTSQFNVLYLVQTAVANTWNIFGQTQGITEATGCTITTNGNYRIHQCSTAGANTITISAGSGSAEWAAVGAGGAGGTNGGTSNPGGGGGGGGGITTGTAAALSGSYTITIGAGGTSTAALNTQGTAGGDTIVSGTNISTTAGGGGFAGSYLTTNVGGNGRSANGSGGGGSYIGGTGGTANGTGGNGGTGGGGGNGCGAGGGGAGGNATNCSSDTATNGGAGAAVSICGGAFATTWGGGGGGGASSVAGTGGTGGGGNGTTAGAGNAGTSGTGGGGGGAYSGAGAVTGGTGGTGSFVLCYQYKY